MELGADEKTLDGVLKDQISKLIKRPQRAHKVAAVAQDYQQVPCKHASRASRVKKTTREADEDGELEGTKEEGGDGFYEARTIQIIGERQGG